jgi:hypothetical protein
MLDETYNLQYPKGQQPNPQASGLYPATERQAVRALLSAILNHRDVRNPKIYYPVLQGNNPPEIVPITAALLTAGVELVNPGLTLAVYPAFSPFKAKTGAPDHRIQNKSISYQPRYLGQAKGPGYGEVATLRLTVQLYYRDASYRSPVTLKSKMVPESNVIYDPAKVPQFGRNIEFDDSPTLEIPNPQTPENLPQLPTVQGPSTVPIFTFPGEEVLRDWMPLLRGVVRDIQILRPFNIRNPTILYVDYPTTNWRKDSEDLVFHTAYFVVEYDYTEPARPEDFNFPPPTFIGLEVKDELGPRL